MKRVYSAADPVLVGYLKSVLEEHRIACFVKNEFLRGAAGELPVNECWPELWVLEEREEWLAGQLIAEALAPAAGTDWACPECGEICEGAFGLCWRCGALRTSPECPPAS